MGELGRVDDAVKQLQGLMKNTPEDRELWLSVAQVYIQAKQFTNAEQAVNKAQGLSSKPEDQEYIHFLMGSVYEREKKYDQAEEQFKQVLATNPLNASAANYFGIHAGGPRRAPWMSRSSTSRRRCSSSPTMEPTWGQLGLAYYKSIASTSPSLPERAAV